jgi:hypothetical protein
MGKYRRQRRQRVPKVDHLIEPGTEKIIGRYRFFRCFSQIVKAVILIRRGFCGRMNRANPALDKGWRGFAGATIHFWDSLGIMIPMRPSNQIL